MQRFAGILQGRQSQSHRLLNSSKYGNPSTAIVSKNCQIKQNQYLRNHDFRIFTENWRLEYPRCKLYAPLRKFNLQQG
jgi:hypothetical protein